MTLNDKQLRTIFDGEQSTGFDPTYTVEDGVLAGLRAVEAAVRADALSEFAANRRAFRRALEVHDRQVSAKALTDAAHDWDEVPDRTPRTGTETGPWLLRRAVASSTPALGVPVSPESEGKE